MCATLVTEVIGVSKSAITRIFVAGLVAMAGGVVLFFAAMGLAYAGDSFVMDGSDVTGIRSAPASWILIGLAAASMMAIVGGAVAQFVAWVAAVLNTARLQDKTWFIVLLVTGLMGFGTLAMIIYCIVGPDGSAPAPPRRGATATPAHA